MSFNTYLSFCQYVYHLGADMNAQTEETQETALTLACCGGFAEVADLLIKGNKTFILQIHYPLCHPFSYLYVFIDQLFN